MFVFLLGRPGCGKSIVFKKIKEHLSKEITVDEITRVDDFPKLWMIFQEEEKTELTDDKDELIQNSPAPLFIISTEWEGEGRLNEVSKNAAEFIKVSE